MGTKLFISGAEGFIGSHLVELAVEEGYSVCAGVQYNSFGNTGWLENLGKDVLSNVEISHFDIRDADSVEAAVGSAEQVIHLAALIAIPYSFQAPKSYLETNVMGTLNILNVAKKIGVSRFIHTSTSEVYGTAQYVPIDESHPINTQSPYAASKAAADNVALSYFHSFELPVSVARPFNTFGPRQSMRAVIPTIIAQALAGKTEIHIGAQNPTRDFTYVKDTCRAFLRMLSSEKTTGQVINFGSGFEIPIRDIISLVSRILGTPLEPKEVAERLRPKAAEVDRLLADSSKAKELMNWEPTRGGLSGFQQNLETTIDWFSSKENLSKYKPEIYAK